MVNGDTSYPFLWHAAKGGHQDKQTQFSSKHHHQQHSPHLKGQAIPHMPKAAPGVVRKNASEWCSLHKRTSHATRSCQVLRDQIEELLDQGNCWEFVRDKPRKEGFVEPNEMEWWDQHTDDEYRRPAKKPTININCVCTKFRNRREWWLIINLSNLQQ